MTRAFGFAVLIGVCGIAAAIGPEEPFADPALEADYQALIREVRCLVCQNQTIADSSAPLAADLRREIRELMADGASRDDVSQFLVERYGDFVLYRPPLQPTTWALWGAPVALCLLGLFVFARIVRARLQQPLGEDLPPQ
jgi:cytochrome c-type biogenesis protein CcmH